MSEHIFDVVSIERINDLPLLFEQMQQMNVTTFLDQCFPTHGNWAGSLTLGEVTSLWLCFILSEGDHRLSQVEAWAAAQQRTLGALVNKPARPTDFSDDRLADILTRLGDAERWPDFETSLNSHLLRVYDLTPSRVRIDTTTAQTYAGVDGEGRFQFGYNATARGDLAQIKLSLSSLDPIGLPLLAIALSGKAADQPTYLPQVKRVRRQLGRRGLTYIGDSKLSTLANRAEIAVGDDYYLCPLGGPQLQASPLEELLEPFLSQGQSLIEVRDDEDGQLIAAGFERRVWQEAIIDRQAVKWEERQLLIRSEAFAERENEQLTRRLAAVEGELAKLNERKRGKKRLSAEELSRACARIVERQGVSQLIEWQIVTRTIEEGRQSVSRSEVKWELKQAAIERARQLAGWRVYVTNHRAEQMSLPQAVGAYREQYLIERGFGRLKGRLLGLMPLYLQEEQRVVGLINLLLIGLRALCLLEFQVRRALGQETEPERRVIRGLYAGQAGRANSNPTSELMLRAFRGIHLLVQRIGDQLHIWVTPLSALQERILQLLGFPQDLYQRLINHLQNPVPI